MVRQPVHVRTDDKQSGEPIPPLEPGDRLSRDEFERRYEAMPRGIKAELLEGVVRNTAKVALSAQITGIQRGGNLFPSAYCACPYIANGHVSN
jgi:hypothetical protein